MNNIAEYINELTDSQGVSVVTVSDGWVFTFTRSMLETLIAEAEQADSTKVAVFVKSSADAVKN